MLHKLLKVVKKVTGIRCQKNSKIKMLPEFKSHKVLEFEEMLPNNALNCKKLLQFTTTTLKNIAKLWPRWELESAKKAVVTLEKAMDAHQKNKQNLSQKMH